MIDVVVCNFMFHDPKNEWIIPEIKRILKPEGFFLVANPIELEEEIKRDNGFSLLISLRQLSPFVEKSGINPSNLIEH